MHTINFVRLPTIAIFFRLLYDTAPWFVGVCSWRDIYWKPKHWSWWSAQVVFLKSIHQM